MFIDKGFRDEPFGSPPVPLKDLTKLWMAAKHHDSQRIRKYLLDHLSLNIHRNSEKCSLLAPTEEAKFLHRSLFGSYMNEDEEDGDDEYASHKWRILDLSTPEKKFLYFRSLLLLPAYTSTPWDAIDACIHKIILHKDSARIDDSNMTRKYLACIQFFFSSIFQNTGDGDDLRTVYAQMDKLCAFCDELVEHLYMDTSPQDFSTNLVEDVFQMLISLFHASVRIEHCVEKKEGMDSSTTSADTALRTELFSAKILQRILRIENDTLVVRKVHFVIIPALLSAAVDLLKDVPSEYWPRLQKVALYSIQQSSFNDSDCIIVMNSIMSTIILHLSSSISEGVSRNWVAMVFVMYHNASFHEKLFEKLEVHLCSLLTNLPQNVFNLFVDFAIVECTPARSTDIIESEIPVWVRANFLLLASHSRLTAILIMEGTTTIAKKLPLIDAERSTHVRALEPIVAFMTRSHERYLGNPGILDIMKGIDVTAYNAIEMLKHTISLHTQSIDFSSKAVLLRDIFKECSRVVRCCFFTNNGESVRKIVWKRRKCWREIAHLLIEATIPNNDGNIDGAVLGGAVLITSFLDDPSCREVIIFEIAGKLYKHSTMNQHVSSIYFYCWILKVMGTVEDLMIFDAFAPIYEVVFRTKHNPISREIVSELICSLTYNRRCRLQLWRNFLQEVELDLFWVHCDNYECPEIYKRQVDILVGLVGRDFDNDGDTSLDGAGLDALGFISDAIVAKEHVLPNTARLVLLRRILFACNAGTLHDTVLERIMNATLVCILPYFRLSNQRNTYDIDFVPSYFHLQCKKRLVTEEEFLLLIQLLIVSLQDGCDSENYLVGGVFDEYGFNLDLWEVLSGTAATERKVLLCIRALARFIAEKNTAFGKMCTNRSEDNSSCGIHYSTFLKRVYRNEKEFWAKLLSYRRVNKDVTVNAPKWIHYEVHSDNDENLCKIRAKSLPPSMLSSLSAIFANRLLSVDFSSLGKESSPADHDFERYFNLSFASNSILQNAWTINERKEKKVGLRFYVGYECLTIGSYFSLTAWIHDALLFNLDGECDHERRYMDLILPATYEICRWLDEVFDSKRNDTCPKITIYGALVKFYISVCSGVCKEFTRFPSTRSTPANISNGNAESFHAYYNKLIRQLRITVLPSLGSLAMKPLLNFAPKKSEQINDELSAHCRLLQDLCKNLRLDIGCISGRGDQETNSLCRLYVETSEKLINKVNYLLSHHLKFDYMKEVRGAVGWFRSMQASEQVLWDVLKETKPGIGTSLIIKKLIPLMISSIPGILRLLSRLSFRFFDAGVETCSVERRSKDFSPAAIVLHFHARRDDVRLTNEDQLKHYLSWLADDNNIPEEWILPFCLRSMERVWTESNQIIHGAFSVLLTAPKIIRRGDMISRYIKDQISELSSNLESTRTFIANRRSLSTIVLSSLYNLIERVAISLSSALTCLMHYNRNITDDWNDRGTHNPDLASVEAYICMISCLKSSSSEGAKSKLSNHNFLIIARLLCEVRKGHGKKISPRPLKILNRIEDIEGALQKLSKIMKGRAVSGCETNYVEVLVCKITKEDVNLINLIDNHLRFTSRGSIVGNGIGSKRETHVSPLTEKHTEERNGHAIARRLTMQHSLSLRKGIRQKVKKKRSKNNVLNQWMDLDQELDERGGSGCYGNLDDLEDFILPG